MRSDDTCKLRIEGRRRESRSQGHFIPTHSESQVGEQSESSGSRSGDGGSSSRVQRHLTHSLLTHFRKLLYKNSLCCMSEGRERERRREGEERRRVRRAAVALRDDGAAASGFTFLSFDRTTTSFRASHSDGSRSPGSQESGAACL